MFQNYGVINIKKSQKIIHHDFVRQNVYNVVDNVYKSVLKQVFSKIYYVSRPHSYQQVVCY